MRAALIALLIALFLIIPPAADASCSVAGCGGSGGDSWETGARDFMDSDVPLIGVSQTGTGDSQELGTTSSFRAGASVVSPANGTYQQIDREPTTDLILPDFRSGLFIKGDLLEPMSAVSGSDLLLDVSNQRMEGQGRAKGAISLPVGEFLYENGTLKPVPEIAQILGAAGVSRDEPAVVYSDSFSSGEATLMVWILCYLGQDCVRAMDGDLKRWMYQSLPLESVARTRNSTTYDYRLLPELRADCGCIESGEPQLVDARTFQEYGKSRLPSAIFIAPEQVLEDGRIAAGEKLNDTFARLDKNRPVVVYSQDLFKASLVWYALQLMGFDSRIFNWQEWDVEEPSGAFVIR